METYKDETSPLWKELNDEYEIIKLLGYGAFGQVMKAKNLVTDEVVSIKLMHGCFKSIHRSRMLLRELMILRKLSEMEDNIFTTKLYDIILPKGVVCKDLEATQESSENHTLEFKKKKSDVTNPVAKPEELDSEVDVTINFKNLTYIFIVMEYVDTDFQKLLNAIPQTELSEDHIIVIVYNMLCALNFLHSANVIHRDLKPSNFLIDSQCSVKICDFGLSRAMNPKTDLQKET
jgi:mitogen-activated protein kinase 1/3